MSGARLNQTEADPELNMYGARFSVWSHLLAKQSCIEEVQVSDANMIGWPVRQGQC
jgi:hypothetical protein